MANAIYPKYKQSALSGDANTDLIQSGATVAPFVAMVNTTSYTYNATHQFYSSLAGVVGTDQQLTTPVATNGTFDADDVTYTSVTGSAVGALVIYRKNAGANTTWRLTLYEDTGVTGLPVTPNGGNITITWNASGIFLISDVRAKENLRHIGELGHLDLGIYQYNYHGDPRPRVGLVAQEVLRSCPHAVIEFRPKNKSRSYLAVNYEEVIRRAA